MNVINHDTIFSTEYHVFVYNLRNVWKRGFNDRFRLVNTHILQDVLE